MASAGPRVTGKQPHPSLSPTFLPSGLIFYDTKVTVMNRVLNATVQRTADHAAPEITLDPLEIVGGTTSYTDQGAGSGLNRLVCFSYIKEAVRRRESGVAVTSPHSSGCFCRSAPVSQWVASILRVPLELCT